MSSVTDSSVLTPTTNGKKASTAKKPAAKAPAKSASANTANNSNTPAANATGSNKEKDTMSTSTATATEPTGTSEASDFVVTTEPPKFVSGQGRGKSQLRIAIEALEVGQFLQVGPATEKLKNSTRSMVSSIQTDAKTRGDELAFSVREDAEGNLWVGRKEK